MAKKNHVNVDRQHKLMRQYTVTHAAVHDRQVFEEVLLPAEVEREGWDDLADRSEASKARLVKPQSPLDPPVLA